MFWQVMSLPRTASVDHSLSQHDKDVLAYIGGFILFKMRDMFPNTVSDLKELHLSSNDCNIWIRAINRGGLTAPNENFVSMVLDLERVFRDTDTPDRPAFVAAVMKLPLTALDLPLDFISKVANLFYNIRIHQKCRTLIQRQAYKSKSVLTKKALRDSI